MGGEQKSLEFKMADPGSPKLTPKEEQRGLDIFELMDADKSGQVDVEEICIVHDSDKDAMLKILDDDGNGEVSKDEWLKYLQEKKKEKGKKKFQFFLNYLEQEVPKNMPKIEEARAAKEPPNLGLKDSRIKDAFTNLMFAIQDLDAAVGQG